MSSGRSDRSAFLAASLWARLGFSALQIAWGLVALMGSSHVQGLLAGSSFVVRDDPANRSVIGVANGVIFGLSANPSRLVNRLYLINQLTLVVFAGVLGIIVLQALLRGIPKWIGITAGMILILMTLFGFSFFISPVRILELLMTLLNFVSGVALFKLSKTSHPTESAPTRSS
jgi:hypothetical protein